MQGLRKAPNAVYALVQTTLVQDEALKHADSRIQELEAAAGQQNQPAGFLDSMRDAIFGQSQQQGQGQSQGSVPNVRAPGISGSRPAWNTGQVLQQGQPAGQYGQPGYAQPYGAQQPQQQSPFGGGGGSFLGTAAAAAVGVVGGSMLASSLRSMMGGSAATSRASATPRATAAASKTAGRGAISPAAIWRATPGSTTSVRPASAPTTTIPVRGRDSSIRPRTTRMTTWIMIPTVSTATVTVTAITPERRLN